MKLIDLLVKELPKRGGWPDGVSEIGQDYDGELMFYGRGNARTRLYLPLSSDHRDWCCHNGDRVTKDRYESALAASKKPAWNGEGLPPVGCECEISFYGKSLGQCEVLFVGDSLIVWKQKSSQQEVSGHHGHMNFRPLRTEAERKRDAAIEAMQREADDGDNWIYSEYEIIYDAIAAGKIPGVKLED